MQSHYAQVHLTHAYFAQSEAYPLYLLAASRVYQLAFCCIPFQRSHMRSAVGKSVLYLSMR